MPNDVKSKREILLERLKSKHTDAGHASEHLEAVALPPELSPADRLLPRPELASVQGVPGGALFALGKLLGIIPKKEKPDISFFSASGAALTAEQKLFLYSLEAEAKRRCLLLEEPETEGKEPESADMSLHIAISKNELEAWAIALPPVRSTGMLTQEQIQEKVAGALQFGIDHSALLDLLKAGGFLKLFVIARGDPGEDGKNGEVIDRFSRDRQIHLAAKDDKNMDYRNLHWLQKIAAGDVVCDLVQPTEGKNGTTVRGGSIRHINGVMPPVPMGVNTQINGEKTALVATCDGQLSFEKGKFTVAQSLKIKGNVDNSVGDLDVIGDLEIFGDVGDGYSLRATGNITVHGLVEGAFLEAGGDVQVFLGMKGNGRGSIVAKGSVTSKYLENSTVRAGNGVTAESIINCSVSSGDFVAATSGRGVIIGGKIATRNRIEAKIIGNESNRATDLVVGVDPAVLEEIVSLTGEEEVLKNKIQETELNINYVERNLGIGKFSHEMLSKLKLKYTVDKMALEKKLKHLATLKEQLDDTGCQVIASSVFPQTSVEIGGMKYLVKTASRMCRIYKDQGEIKLGTK